MDSPLTTAELSRLRKAIQQRDRLVAQGLVTLAVDSRISSALSNLKLYLPAQIQLAAVLRDWETSDCTKRSQITLWLQQNILDDDQSQANGTPPIAPPSPAFVHPPPPPPLPSRAASLVSRTGRPSSSGTPTPALVHGTPVQAPSSTINIYPPREIHTQASLKPPTPPPKDGASVFAQESLTRRHTFAGRPPNSCQSGNFVENLTNERCPDSSGSPLYPSAFSGRNLSQPSTASLNSNNATESPRRSRTQASQPTPPSYSHTPDPNRPGPPGHDSGQRHTPPGFGQPTPTSQLLSDLAQGYTQQQNIFVQGGTPNSQYNQQLTTALAKIQAQQAQQSSNLLQQISQAQQSSTSSTTAQILAAAQQQQAQHQANFLNQLQAQQAASTNSTTQLLASIQQQQQAQTNQMISMLQQYQQNATNFNPYQNAQQNQQMLREGLQESTGQPSQTGRAWIPIRL
ncbi:unnamed protein product [Rhizoctonia solani]|uniref:Uncharacterized protein n=1 Tax=Rhizoctonia solani TaxID=456999 RepID=A0A8H2WM68_9AGAM|nr:unnamed protein product [Rhizoctonia solani]